MKPRCASHLSVSLNVLFSAKIFIPYIFDVVDSICGIKKHDTVGTSPFWLQTDAAISSGNIEVNFFGKIVGALKGIGKKAISGIGSKLKGSVGGVRTPVSFLLPC